MQKNLVFKINRQFRNLCRLIKTIRVGAGIQMTPAKNSHFISWNKSVHVSLPSILLDYQIT